jgi:hypothetical protein
LPDGQWVVACDPWHKVPSPHLYRIEEVMACWRAMTAPVMLVTADEGYVMQRFGKHPEELQRRMDCFATAASPTSTTAGTTCSTIGRKSSPS